jgi:hypothetical protein
MSVSFWLVIQHGECLMSDAAKYMLIQQVKDGKLPALPKVAQANVVFVEQPRNSKLEQTEQELVELIMDKLRSLR